MDYSTRITHAHAHAHVVEEIRSMSEKTRQVILDLVRERAKLAYLQECVWAAQELRERVCRTTPSHRATCALWHSPPWRQYCLEEIFRFALRHNAAPKSREEGILLRQYLWLMCEVTTHRMLNRGTGSDECVGAIGAVELWNTQYDVEVLRDYELVEMLSQCPELSPSEMVRTCTMHLGA